MNKPLVEKKRKKGECPSGTKLLAQIKPPKTLHDSSPSLSSSSNPGYMGALFLTAGSQNPQLCGLGIASIRRTFHWKLNPLSAQRPSHASHSFPQALKQVFETLTNRKRHSGTNIVLSKITLMCIGP